MLTNILGNVGDGKTLLLTMIGYFAQKEGKKVISNYKLEYPFESFDIKKFLQAEYDNCVLLLDEAYVYLESRDSGLTRNKSASYVLFQSRKKSIDMYLSMQLLSTIDVRYRELMNNVIHCNHIEGIGYSYIFMNGKKQIRKRVLLYENAEEFYKMYDTNEIIGTEVDINEFLTKPELKAIANSTAKLIWQKYSYMRITKATVESYCFDNDVPKVLENVIYQKVMELKKLSEL